METRIIQIIILTGLMTLSSCHSAKQPTTEKSITGKYWRLIELNGAAIQSSQGIRREPHLILNDSTKRVSGNGGCNSFFGSFEFQGETGIRFSKIGSTKMACANEAMQVESQFFQVLETTENYSVRNDSLFLSKGNISLLAKFVLSSTK